MERGRCKSSITLSAVLGHANAISSDHLNVPTNVQNNVCDHCVEQSFRC